MSGPTDDDYYISDTQLLLFLDSLFPEIDTSGSPPTEEELQQYPEFLPPQMNQTAGGSVNLLAACTFGRTSEAFSLLRNGTNPNIVDHENRTPLMLALEAPGEFDNEFVNFLIQTIIEKGGDLDIEDNTNGATALIKACAKGHTEAALQLIEAGASLDFVDVGDGEEEERMTALDYAIGRELRILVDAIRRKGGHTFAELNATRGQRTYTGRSSETSIRISAGAGSDPGPRLCCICLVNPTTHAFIPCNHFCACEECANIMNIMTSRDKKCPICRLPLRGSIRIFIS